jgi:hypothetical protein
VAGVRAILVIKSRIKVKLLEQIVSGQSETLDVGAELGGEGGFIEGSGGEG